jgi:purine catabolism regulator
MKAVAKTVAEIIKMPIFKDMKIIAGEQGKSRQVSSVGIIDAPDMRDWVKGGEFLLTNGYIMKDDPSQLKDFIISIEKAGASAMGIKLKRFIDVLPDEVIETADKLQFPIISLPINFAYIEILNPILTDIINEQSGKLMFSEKIHRSFTKLVLKGGNTQEIIDTLSSIIKKDVMFFDTYFNSVYVNSRSSVCPEQFTKPYLQQMLSKYKNHPIRLNNRNYGYILLIDRDSVKGSRDYESIAVEHASTVLILDTQKKISNHQIESKYRDEFIQDLIMNNIKSTEEATAKGSLYGWKFSSGLTALAIEIDNYKQEYLSSRSNSAKMALENMRHDIYSASKKILRKYFTNSLHTNFSETIVFLIEPLSDDNISSRKRLDKALNELKNYIHQNFKFTITVGIGAYTPSIIDVHLSYDKAKRALEIGKQVYGSNSIVHYDQLGIYKLLAPISETGESKELYNYYLADLLEYDKRNNSALLSTLKHIVKNDWNLKETAGELYLHYNTVKYRFNKIGEIMGIDLHDGEHKTGVSIALKLLLLNE